jgi:ribosomal protein S18 acetylase RimI-like enzyme
MTEFELRPAGTADLEGITVLAGSRERAEVRLMAAERGDESTTVAEVDGRIVGVVSVRWDEGCDPPNPWLYGLQVAEEHRRLGLGRALIGAVEDAATQRGADQVSLDVDLDDDAVTHFYEDLGYVVLGPHLHHWRTLDPHTGAMLDEGTSPTLIMRRALR